MAVLNASRHHGDDGRRPRREVEQPRAVCSTPRGITATTGRGSRWRTSAGARCSTPRGITATTGHTLMCALGREAGAQRLAASRRRRAHHRQHGERLGGVLNASRHHGDDGGADELPPRGAEVSCSTPRGITATTGRNRGRCRCGQSCAQRLAASRRRRGTRHPLWVRHPPGAQRLAASRRRRGARHRRCGDGGRVLNASRHHGDDGGHTRHNGARPVTGAQRLAASRRRRDEPLDLLRRRHRVLNASRHHGDDGPTALRFERLTTWSGAQRLAASRRRRVRHLRGACK